MSDASNDTTSQDEPAMYRSVMHLPFEGNPDDQGGFKVSFACGFDTVIPIEIMTREVQGILERCRCPGCGAHATVISVVYRSTDPT